MNLIVSTRTEAKHLRFEVDGRWQYGDALQLAYLVKAAQGRASLDRFLIEKPAQTVLVRVKGESMINAGIHSGDLAIVERRLHADPGELVVAIIDDEFTLKTLGRDQEGPHLIPANPDFPIIRPQGKLELFGVVVGLVRKYS